MSQVAGVISQRIEEMVCEDRISALPQDLLIKILMRIPTKDAMATMVLSKQWRFIWTMLPILDFDEDDDDDYTYYYDDDNYDETKKSVWWFLNKSMEQHKAPFLRSLRIKLGSQCPTDADVGKWVAHAVSRGVITLGLKLGWSADPIRLPNSLYTCKTLDRLTLSNKILVDFPSSCCLPSLAILELYFVTYKDEASLVNLLSSCPVLEILSVKRKKDDNVAKFSVKVPSLRALCYAYETLLPDDNDVVETGRCLVMDTPRLETLHISDYSGDSCSVENMPCLEDAYVHVESFPGLDKFLTSLSSVSSLVLSLTSEMMICCSAIKFSRLTKCEICPGDSDWMDSLVPLLVNTPKLKSLIIDYGSTHNDASECSASWTEFSECHPICMTSSLEEFELIDYGGREEEQELVEYILTYALCLKTATISFNSELEPDQDKETMMEELKAIPRYSTTSQLLFETNTSIM